MTSSNRHWPSMFKSKPTYTAHNLQDHQYGSNHLLTSANSHRSSPYTTSGCDERTPEPKPRWNPKPEQIRILESIFNSGMVNPPRDEIKKIRGRLQEYGQVGDANVFYWFQNRKSRSKNKTRHLQKSQSRQAPPVYAAATKTATTTSSSSSDKSSSKSSTEFLLNSSTVPVNQQPQAYLGGGGGDAGSHHQFFQDSFFFPVVQQASLPPTTGSCTQEFCFPEVIGSMINQQENHNDQTIVSNTGMLFTDLMMNHQYGIPNRNSKSKVVEEENTPPPPPPVCTSIITPPLPTPVPVPTSTIIPSTIDDHVQGDHQEGGTGKLIVFINDLPFEVVVGPFNVKEAFGSDAVLIDASGQTLVTNDWGVTTESLQHGAFYYLVRPFTFDHAAGTTIDLVDF